MNKRRIALWSLTLIAGGGVIYLAGKTIFEELRKSQLYAAGQAAAADGQWTEAFASLHALAEIDPGYRDVQEQLEEAAGRVAETVPGESDLSIEVELLRYLASSGEIELLADVLDRSVVYVPAGEFVMGSDTNRTNERPQHLVYLDAFEINRYEITNAQYQRFVQETGQLPPRHWSGDEYPSGQADYPVVGVSWIDADAYCTWAGWRLPTEAEWEKTCRGTDGQTYPWGEEWDPNRGNVGISEGVLQAEMGPMAWEDAWMLLQDPLMPSRVSGPRPVGSYSDGASPYGALDLVGNATEWVADWYNWDGYWNLPDRNPQSLEPPWNHIIRGSSWYPYYSSTDWVEEQSRCSARNSSHSADEPRAGFRCARSIPSG